MYTNGGPSINFAKLSPSGNVRSDIVSLSAVEFLISEPLGQDRATSQDVRTQRQAYLNWFVTYSSGLSSSIWLRDRPPQSRRPVLLQSRRRLGSLVSRTEEGQCQTHKTSASIPATSEPPPRLVDTIWCKIRVPQLERVVSGRRPIAPAASQLQQLVPASGIASLTRCCLKLPRRPLELYRARGSNVRIQRSRILLPPSDFGQRQHQLLASDIGASSGPCRACQSRSRTRPRSHCPNLIWKVRA
ncbi:hypothetical protein C8Q78DRAFT_812352 [Trametes maxima]|nr:hypothetical protein C8Q78DRAFT_812352 [Trametes maxima]